MGSDGQSDTRAKRALDLRVTQPCLEEPQDAKAGVVTLPGVLQMGQGKEAQVCGRRPVMAEPPNASREGTLVAPIPALRVAGRTPLSTGKAALANRTLAA